MPVYYEGTCPPPAEDPTARVHRIIGDELVRRFNENPAPGTRKYDELIAAIKKRFLELGGNPNERPQQSASAVGPPTLQDYWLMLGSHASCCDFEEEFAKSRITVT